MSSIRRVAALATLPLVAAGLVGVAAQPATAAADPTLTWSFSDYLSHNNGVAGFTSHVASGGATSSGADVVFGGGEGAGSLAGGDLHLSYDGTVTYTWHIDITFSNPEVIVEGGTGKIVADVGWALPETGSANDVVLTTFDPATATLEGDSFSATPDWTSGSWAPELLAALPDSVDAFFKVTGSSSDARKAPATFTSAASEVEVEPGDPTVAVESSYEGRSVLIDVDGTGFSAVTQPGDMGVYVALAPAGDFPETDDFEDQEKVADSEWVMPTQMADGSFSVTLDPENQYLDYGTDYSVYTWQAHTHSNPSQDTETPVTIDWARLKSATALKLDLVKKPTSKKGGKLAVDAGEATGKVAVKLIKGSKSVQKTGILKAGKVTVALPKLAKGSWKATVTYAGTEWFKAAKKTLSFNVR